MIENATIIRAHNKHFSECSILGPWSIVICASYYVPIIIFMLGSDSCFSNILSKAKFETLDSYCVQTKMLLPFSFSFLRKLQIHTCSLSNSNPWPIGWKRSAIGPRFTVTDVAGLMMTCGGIVALSKLLHWCPCVYRLFSVWIFVITLYSANALSLKHLLAALKPTNDHETQII